MNRQIKTEVLGRHLLLDLSGCDGDLLAQAEGLEALFCEAVRTGGATVVSSHFHQFAPQGVSGVVVLAESHVTVHTWPEAGFAAVDIFTCGSTFKPEAIEQAIVDALAPRSVKRHDLTRKGD